MRERYWGVPSWMRLVAFGIVTIILAIVIDSTGPPPSWVSDLFVVFAVGMVALWNVLERVHGKARH